MHTAKPALTPAKFLYSFGEFLRSKIWPKRWGEKELGIGRLPEQEIADPMLTGCPDDEIRIRKILREEMCLQHVFGEVIG